jgi:DNA-binding winged helix-turn-helix (wHTH) protein/tetratricopeptide (TPR) repeat protein
MPERDPAPSAPNPRPTEVYAFGPFRVDEREGLLLCAGRSVELTAKVFETLLLFVRNPGRLLTREELAGALWPDAAVQDANLTQNIWMLRKALAAADPAGGDGERYVETVPRRGYRFIAAVSRVADAPPVTGTGPAGVGTAPPADGIQPSKRRLPPRAWAVAGAVMVLVGLTSWQMASRLRRGAINPRRTAVAVLDFKNLSARAEDGWLGVAIAEMLGTELRGAERLRVVSGEWVAQARPDLTPHAGEGSPAGARLRLARRLGTDLLVVGSFTRAGEDVGAKLRFDVRIEEAASERLIAAMAETGNETELFDIVSRLGARMQLAVLPGEAGSVGRARAALPTDPGAARFYAQALARLRRGETPQARDLLLEAVKAEPDCAVLHAALAAAWTSLGYDGKARSEAQRAFELSAALPQEQRLRIEALYRERTRDWPRAMEIYRTLLALYPDELDHGLRLLAVQRMAGLGKEALATAAELRRVPGAQDDPRVDLAEARACASASEYRRGQAVAARAAERAGAIGAYALAGRAYAALGDHWDSLGEPQKALAAFSSARENCEQAGDHACVGDVINDIAIVESGLGDLAGARAHYEEALRIAQPLGNAKSDAATLNNLAILFKGEGDLVAAQAMYEHALALKRESGDRLGEARVLSNLGSLLLDRGELAGARDHVAGAVAIRSEVGDREGLFSGQCVVARVATANGDFPGAERALQASLAASREVGASADISCALHTFGELLDAKGDRAGARKSYEESLALRRKQGAKVDAADTLVRLGRLEVAEGRPAEGEKRLREALETFVEAKLAPNQAVAWTGIAEALLAQGQAAQAAEAIESARKALGERPYRLLQLDRTVVEGRVLGALGRRDDSRRILEGAAAEARQRKLGPLETRARQALARIAQP